MYREIKRQRMLKKYNEVSLMIEGNVSIIDSEIGFHVFLGDKVFLNNSVIGDHSYTNSNTHINFTKIGKFCSIGSNVIFGLGSHPTDLISTHPAFYSKNKKFQTFADKEYFEDFKEINLGNDIWIGSDVRIMGGVSIADGAIIAAGAIVTRDVQPYEVVGGIPAKHIKYRINKDLIEKIRGTKWWDKDEDWLIENYNLFLNNELFLDYFSLK